MQTEPDAIATPGILDILLVLKRWRKFIFLNVVAVTTAAAIVSFLLPRWYQSSATILPPKNANPLGALGLSSSSLMKQLSPLRALGGTSASPDLYSYLSILKSRSLLEQVVSRFNLRQVYDIDPQHPNDAAAVLLQNVDFVVNEEGTLTITVADKDAGRAVRMANFFVQVLDSLNRDLSMREAHSNRQFIENRVDQNRADLKSAEENLKAFQEKHGVVAMSTEATASAGAIAELYAQKLAKEFEVGYLEHAVGKDNPRRTAAEMELAEMNRKLADVPEVGMQFFRLYREYLIQQKLFETLLPLLEQAKIEEQRTIPTLLVLDRASVPDKPSSPKKKLIVIIFFVMALLVSVAVAFLSEAFSKMRSRNPNAFSEVSHGWFSRRTDRPVPPGVS